MKFLKSLLQSFKNAFTANEEVQKLVNKHPRIVDFLKQRFDRTKFTGLPMTIFVVAFLYALLLFLGAVENFITSDIIVSADARINTLFYVFRNASTVKTFLWITLLGKSSTIIVFALLSSLLLWLWNKRWLVATLWLTIIGSAGFVFITKMIFHRPRPANAVYLENSASFPSGHAAIAVAFYGFLAYSLARNIKSKKYRVLGILAGIIIVLAIGFSRLYLGVHYVSDIWTGYLVGLLWLIIGISITEWELFQVRNTMDEKKPTHKHAGAITASLVSVGLIFYVASGVSYHPKLTLSTPAAIWTTVSDATSIFTDLDVPRYSETLTGETQEPVSFIIAAKDDAALAANFEKAGWSLADPVDYHSTFKLIKFSILDEEYSTAPMTPSFWNKQVHDFGFEKPTETESARQRHHARFWKTNLETNQGDSIYVGTASLDINIKWLVTHKISPDIDTERELLFADLQKTGAAKNFLKVKLVSPVLGQNFSGDQFFTDGEAYFIHF